MPVLPRAARLAHAHAASRRRREFGDIGQYDYAFNWENYVDGRAEYLPHILRSFGYALAATVLALLFSYPLAYFIGVKPRRCPLCRRSRSTLVIAPFFICFLLRTLAWKQISQRRGSVVTVAEGAVAHGSRTRTSPGTPFAVIFGLTYNFIPFMSLPIYTSLERLDLRYVEAGSDLYASPSTTFRKVTLPLSLPGVVSGTLLTFIPASGDYVNASSELPRRPRHHDDRQRHRGELPAAAELSGRRGAVDHPDGRDPGPRRRLREAIRNGGPAVSGSRPVPCSRSETANATPPAARSGRSALGVGKWGLGRLRHPGVRVPADPDRLHDRVLVQRLGEVEHRLARVHASTTG